MDTFVKFSNQSQGRDRIFRATQYACALLKYLLRNNAEKKKLLTKLQMLRLGNTVSAIETAKRTIHLADPVLNLCLTMANINRALYFLCDNVLWARSLGLIRDIDTERWSRNASRFYFATLVLNLTRDVYEISQLVAQRARDKNTQERMRQHLNDNHQVAEVIVPQLDAFLFLLQESFRANPAVALDTLKNICDLFIPMNHLGIYKTNGGVVGFCGLMSSLLGIVTLLHPSLKIKP
ncbi:Peroxisomal membrane protein 11A [Merluccius polli]|uniref:Peroxisomal membrane protein 11A n=1 Tax=Merluccius polli TaxID=89951 RepID=A0AA47P754_MERPO|nr:Peroxisomal membrane protein 11A [Merluccius polli]KAK0155074.1 Peroxisomal membrane protein 11A [Merluccius polli]